MRVLERRSPATAEVAADDRRRRTRILIWIGLAAIAVAIFCLAFGERGIDPVRDARIANPDPSGPYFYDGVYRGAPAMWGVKNWPQVFEVINAILNIGCWAPFVWIWWRKGRVHPGLTLMMALWIGTHLCDPIVNWGYSAAYDPRLLHFPTDWPYVRLNPTVEPMFGVVGFQWWWLLPGWAGFAIWKRLSLRRPATAFVNRHPLWSIFLLGWAIGTPIDVAGETVMIKSLIWSYTQLLGPQFSGDRIGQFPFLWGPLMQFFLYGGCALAFWRDDRGRTVCGRFVDRYRHLRRRPMVSEVLLASVLLFAAYGFGIGSFAIMKYHAHTIAKPWAYGETKTYDPTGLWEHRGQPGPFNKGAWPW